MERRVTIHGIQRHIAVEIHQIKIRECTYSLQFGERRRLGRTFSSRTQDRNGLVDRTDHVLQIAPAGVDPGIVLGPGMLMQLFILVAVIPVAAECRQNRLIAGQRLHEPEIQRIIRTQRHVYRAGRRLELGRSLRIGVGSQLGGDVDGHLVTG